VFWWLTMLLRPACWVGRGLAWLGEELYRRANRCPDCGRSRFYGTPCVGEDDNHKEEL